MDLTLHYPRQGNNSLGFIQVRACLNRVLYAVCDAVSMKSQKMDHQERHDDSGYGVRQIFGKCRYHPFCSAIPPSGKNFAPLHPYLCLSDDTKRLVELYIHISPVVRYFLP